MYVSIGQAAGLIGVSVSTLRRWEDEDYYKSDYRTAGGHRRYKLDRLKKELLELTDSDITNKDRKTITYSRVSSYDQKLDLVRQTKRLEKYCIDKCYDFEQIEDLGSGINFKKKGLTKVIELIISGKVSRLILTHRDRLLRFGSPLLFKLCKHFNTEIIILDDEKPNSFEQELTADVIEIMTVFTAKMYGRRSHKNKKVVNG